MTSDAGDRFAAELAILRDSVVHSIRHDNVADLKDGLNLYSSLVRTVLEQFRHFQSVTGAPEGPGLFSFYGREMSWLEDDVRTFLANAASEPGSDASQEMLGFVLGLLKLALETRELPAFGAFLQHFTIAWSEGRARTDPDKWPRLRANLLLILENFADFWVGRQLTDSDATQREVLPYAHRLIAEITQLMKISVDNSSPEDLAACAHALDETLRHALDEIGRKARREKSHRRVEPELAAIKSAAALGVESWVRFRVKHDKTEAAVGRSLLERLRSDGPAVTWQGFEAALDRRISDLLGWTWWETDLWENRRGGTLTFDTTVTEAFAEALIEGRAHPPADISDTSLDLKYLIERLKQQVEQLIGAGPDPLGLRDQSDLYTTEVLGRLDELILEMQFAEDRVLADLPLLEANIALFRSAVVEAWNGPRHLRKLGSTTPWDPASTDQAQPTGFGINRLVPKDYFVEQPGVHAEPADLGREMGDGVGRGEDELILDGLRSSLLEQTIAFEDVAGAVVSAVEALVAQGLEPTILVVNSWDLLEALGSVTTAGSSWATADPEDAVRLKDSDVRVLLRYSGTGSYCVVADLKAAVEVTFGPPVVERPDDHVEGPLLIGVEHLDPVRAQELVEADSTSRLTTEGIAGLDAAVMGIQKSAHVRVLEWIGVEVKPQSGGRIFNAIR